MRIDMTKIIVAFRNFANAKKLWNVYSSLLQSFVYPSEPVQTLYIQKPAHKAQTTTAPIFTPVFTSGN